jgi:hypothetical protein
VSNPLRDLARADRQEAIGLKVVDKLTLIARHMLTDGQRAECFQRITKAFEDPELTRDFLGGCLAAAVIALAERTAA